MRLISAIKRLFQSRSDLGELGPRPSEPAPGQPAAEKAISSLNAPQPISSTAPQSASVAPQSLTPAAHGRVLLVHGYSADGKDLLPWKQALEAKGIPAQVIDVANYITLNNEVTIKDLGEAFDRALQFTTFADGSREDNWTFDAIVHSTGMLVVRQWLTSDPYPSTDPRSRIGRLKHLIGLAPARFGSPQAKKGRSWLGALVKGNKRLGPDFLNAGDEVLEGLELASSYTWKLAHKDMLANPPLYNKGAKTPYVAVFIGNRPYEGIAAVANTPGCDGTVRWAGCALNTRKVTLDFRRSPQIDQAPGRRAFISPFSDERLAAPIIAVDGQDHGSIVSDPQPGVVDLVYDFFQLADESKYNDWEKRALEFGEPSRKVMDTRNGTKTVDEGAGWQQLVIHMVDDHGDGVSDYNLQIYFGDALAQSDDPSFPSISLTADTYSADNSYRCFYIQLTKEMLNLANTGKKMWLELIASSGSELIEYEAYTDDSGKPHRLAIDSHDPGESERVKMDITPLTAGGDSLFYPYTTTLLELFVEREPMPLGGVSKLLNFLEHRPQ